MDTKRYIIERKQKRLNTVNKILNALNGKMRVCELVEITGIDKSVISQNLSELKGTHTGKVGAKWFKTKDEFTMADYDNQIKFSFPTKATEPTATFYSSDRHHHTPKPSKHTQVSIGSSFYMY